MFFLDKRRLNRNFIKKNIITIEELQNYFRDVFDHTTSKQYVVVCISKR